MSSENVVDPGERMKCLITTRSSLGRLRLAVLVVIGKGKNERHCLMDVKEAMSAAAPQECRHGGG